MPRRASDVPADVVDAPSREPDPADEAAREELTAMFYSCLTVRQAEILRMRREDKTWAEIAAAQNTSEAAAKMCMARMIARVCEMLD